MVLVYRVAVPRRFAVVANRYRGRLIGAAVVAGSRCYSLQWRRP